MIPMYLAHQQSTILLTAPPVAYFTKEVNPSLDKQPLNFNGGLAKLESTSLANYAIGL